MPSADDEREALERAFMESADLADVSLVRAAGTSHYQATLAELVRCHPLSGSEVEYEAV